MFSRVAMTNLPGKVDILHPCAELEWRECGSLPVDMHNAQAVWLGAKLYVGGGWTSGSGRDKARLYIHTPTTDTWSRTNTPVYYFALVTYHSQLVLVGGRKFVGEYKDGTVTNKLWTLTEHDQWRETLPPMITKRHSASAVEFADNILVAGGGIDTVEVYNGHHWANAKCLPKPYRNMKSTLLNGHWYLMGGWRQRREVCYASLDSLVASCQPSEKPLPSVWKKLPDIPCGSSTAVFGNRLIAVGGEGRYPSSISSIHAYSPHTQSWVHVGDMPIGLDSTCTAVLPTGDLMVIGGYSDIRIVSYVHKARLTFNVVFIDGHFTMETLSQLERIGIRPLRELEAYKRPLQSVVGVDKVDLPINNSSSLLEMWVQGRTSLRPTWRHFFWALREIKLNNLADQLEASLSGVAVDLTAPSNLDVSPGSEETNREEEDNKQEQEIVISAEEEKHIAAIQRAMEERGMLDHTIVHGVFVGPARSGKNSLMERLLGRMPSSVSPSTGVAESVVQVKVIQKSATFAANVKESIWSVMDYDDEAIKLMIINSESKDMVETPIQEDDDISKSGAGLSETKNTNLGTGESKILLDSKSADDEWFEAESSSPDNQPAAQSFFTQGQPQLPDSYVPPLEILKAALRRKGKPDLETLQQHFQKTWSLYLTNTGGQMEFQEVLPLLVSGPSMFFFTFRLDRDITQRYVIEYEVSGGVKAEPYTSTLSIVEGLLQTLSTIAAMGTFIYKGLQRTKTALRPKVFIIGTHKDQLENNTADKYIAKVDQELQKAIKETSHYDNLIEFATSTRLIFAVNNFSESDIEFKNIRSAVERVVVRNEFQMTSPAHWLIFSLALRKLKPYIISFEECLEIAKQCGLEDNEVTEALHFIHSKMGLIRYFQYDDVKDLVVIHPQFLFDKVTDLIVDTFTFEKVGVPKMNKFKQNGIFSLSEFEAISFRNSADIQPFQFAKLLERLRIAAPFQVDGEKKYFFPCVLAHALEDAYQQLMLRETQISQLIVTFECGYCPKGLAGALIKYLMANEMESCYTWEIYTDKIFRNQVSFHVGPLDTIVLRITPTYLEIICIPDDFPNRDKECPLTDICSEVRKAVEAGIKQVTSDINYVNAQHCLTFRCQCKGDHPASLKYLGTEPYILYCSKTNERYPLSPEHELWQVKKPQPHHDPMPPPQIHAKQQIQPPKSFGTSLNEADHHSILFNQLEKYSTEWRSIGRCLGFLPSKLKNIQAKPLLLDSAPSSWLEEILMQWLRSGTATLETLRSALFEAGLGQTATNLHI